MANKEEELEDVRAAAQKKVKALEQQLENEHEERINFVREKHELETRIINLQEMASRSADEEQVSKLKKDLKRTKALLKDAQLMVEKSRNESSNKVVLRQLKNQVQLWTYAYIWLLNRPYGNGVILREQSIPLKCCQPFDFWYTSLKGLDLLMM